MCTAKMSGGQAVTDKPASQTIEEGSKSIHYSFFKLHGGGITGLITAKADVPNGFRSLRQVLD
jgi:hypothetical protein